MESIESVEFFWRPGCGFCMRLERALTKANIPMSKHNIWDDPDAAATVRSVANGNETVPTIRIGNEFHVNPSPKKVRQILEKSAPHLLNT